MSEFIRYDLQHVVTCLQRFAPGIAVAGPAQEYVVDGQALVMAGQADRPPREVVQLPFSASRVTIRSHARLFGLNGVDATTVKVALRPPARGASFFRERRARSLIARSIGVSKLSVPAIGRCSPTGAWLIEDFVAGRAADADDVGDLVGGLRSLYAPTVRYRRLVGSPQSRWLFEQLQEMLGRLAPPLARLPDGAAWPTALCHGDLGTHNLIRGDDGRLWIVDWEKATLGPLAVELGRLYLEYPRLRAELLGLIAGLSAVRDVLPPVQQLAFGSAFALKRRQFSRRMMVNERIGLRGLTPAEAEAEFDRQTAAARAAIAALAD